MTDLTGQNGAGIIRDIYSFNGQATGPTTINVPVASITVNPLSADVTINGQTKDQGSSWTVQGKDIITPTIIDGTLYEYTVIHT